MADKKHLAGRKIDREFVPQSSEHLWGSYHTFSGSALHIATGSTANIHKDAPSGLLDAGGDDTYMAVKGDVTAPLAITAAVAIFGSSFPHGWNTAVLNAPEKVIVDFLNTTYTERYGPPDDFALTILWSFTVSIYLVGGCVGASSAGWLANKFGRKRALIICHVFGFAAAILFGLSKVAKSFEMLIVARFLVGIGCGAGSGLVPMYLTEISPVNIRGSMGVLHQLALTCGIFVSMIFGMNQVLGTEERWPILLALTAAPPLVSAIFLPFSPESPRYLYVNKIDETAAEKALKTLRGLDDVNEDLREMKFEVEQHKQKPSWSLGRLLRAKELRLPLLLVCSLALCQQLSGINFVFYYCTNLFGVAGIPLDKVQYATLGTGFINVLMTAISVPLVEKSGRRILLVGGMSLMFVSMAVLTVALKFHQSVPWLSYLCIVVILTFVVGFAIGLGSIPQFIPAELFKQGPRPPAMSLAGFLNWAANFIVAMLFPTMQKTLGPFSFIVFMVMVLGFGIFIYIYLPETKNKSYEEIYRIFAKHESTVSQRDENENGAVPVVHPLLLDEDAPMIHLRTDPKHEDEADA